MNLLKSLDHSLCAAICLVLGWGAGTLLHECFHAGVALVFGHVVSFGEITLTTGSVFVYGEMSSVETAFVAAAGSVGLVVVGLAMVYGSEDPMMRMVGVVILCRAWIDALPLCDMDGAYIAGSAGYVLACALVAAEVVACGAGLWRAVGERGMRGDD